MVRTPDVQRHEAEPAFVLHSYPYRETSLIVEIYTRNHGRVPLIAKGARRPKSALRGVLLAFQPLLVSWSGRGEVQTLLRAEWQGGYRLLGGRSLICGFYLNELLLKLLPRHDAHEALFDRYAETLRTLGLKTETEATLRAFEKSLLKELGYALTLDREAETGVPVVAERTYQYVVERGPVPTGRDGGSIGVELLGQTLLDIQSDNYGSALTQQQSKALMRHIINHHLGTQTLHTRQLLRDLQQL